MITLDKIKEKQQLDQDRLAIQDRTTTKAVLITLVLTLILATLFAFFYKNKRDRVSNQQHMHDAINAQVS